MSRTAPAENLHWLDLAPAQDDPRQRILAGLLRRPRETDPAFFYDHRGSELFQRITQLPEYYPSRTEQAILSRHAREMAEWAGSGRVLIEPGAGDCAKVQWLIEALAPQAWVPMDVSGDFLFHSAGALARKLPDLPVLAACGDFSRLEELELHLPAGPRLFFYPGSTLGNLHPNEAVRFLRRLCRLMDVDGGLLLGLDRDKDPAILEAAYNDAEGITAEFNRNLLRHLNRLLPADFDPGAFRHRAFYNREQFRIEMHLESLCEQSIDCAGQLIRLAQGETLHTENSYKYTTEGLVELLDQAGLQLRRSWHDPDGLFGVHYCTPA